MPTVTAPSTAGPFAQGSTVPVSFTVAYASSVGSFHTYAFKDGVYNWIDSRSASGLSTYNFNWTVMQPTGTGYVIRTWYVDGSGNWLVSGDSSPPSRSAWNAS